MREISDWTSDLRISAENYHLFIKLTLISKGPPVSQSTTSSIASNYSRLLIILLITLGRTLLIRMDLDSRRYQETKLFLSIIIYLLYLDKMPKNLLELVLK